MSLARGPRESSRRRKKALRGRCIRSEALVRLGLLLSCDRVLGLKMEAPEGSGCLKINLEAGDRARVDPRCLVSCGPGLALRSRDDSEQRSLLAGLKSKLRKNNVEQRRPQQQMLSNAVSSNSTDCLLAPLFPGHITVLHVKSAGDTIPPPTSRRRSRSDVCGQRASGPRHSYSSRRARVDNRNDRGYARVPAALARYVLSSRALVATGPDVIVSPLSTVGTTPEGRQRRKRSVGRMDALSICEGDGPVAVAGCGRLIRVRLRTGQKKVVDNARAVAWTSGTEFHAASGPSSASAKAAATVFTGPGTVYVQTHTLAGLRHLLLPNVAPTRHGFSGSPGSTRGVGAAGRAGVGISLKAGLAKRAKTAASRAVVTLSMFAVYVILYSLVTTLLMEGREGLVRLPNNVWHVLRSLAQVMRRILFILVKLGQEELWRRDGGNARDVACVRS